MDASTIDKLSAHDPASPVHGLTLGAWVQDKDRRKSPLDRDAKDFYLGRYTKPNFGWYIARQYSAHDLPFPPTFLGGRDQWVYRAYMFQRDPFEYYNHTIAHAYHLAHTDTHTVLRDGVQAMLLNYSPLVSIGAHLEDVARRTGVAQDVVEAFELLFFNVLDRYEDGLYLANTVYPSTRGVEFSENYLNTSSFSEILKRVAYNNRGDLDLTAYLTGIGDQTYLKKIAASPERESDLTKFMMGNGLILSHSNLLNQRSIGLSRASTLLAASRQSGKAEEEPPISGIYNIISPELHAAFEFNRDQVVDQMRREEAEIVINV